MPTPKRILITRSRHQTSALATGLQALGAEPILIPTISIAPPGSFAPLDHALANLATFDWLLFTSANAVHAFAQRSHALGHDLSPDPAKHRGPYPPAQSAQSELTRTISKSAPPRPISVPRIAAIGPATAQALASLHLTPDLIPPHAVAESLAQSLLPHITPGQTRILLLRAEHARDILPDTLTAAGAHLTLTPAYRNLIPLESIPLLQSIFAAPGTWPDAITFTSSSTASNLLTLLDAAHLTLPPDGALGRTILRASIGPITSATLRDLGYPPHLEAREATIPSLVQLLATHLKLSKP